MTRAVSYSPLVPQPDTSRRPEQNRTTFTRGVGKRTFPHKLFDMMKIDVDTVRTDVVAWTPNELEFIIHNHARFASDVLPDYFRPNIRRKFGMQLNAWGFICMNPSKQWQHFGGKVYTHPSFQKGRYDLLKLIVSVKLASVTQLSTS